MNVHKITTLLILIGCASCSKLNRESNTIQAESTTVKTEASQFNQHSFQQFLAQTTGSSNIEKKAYLFIPVDQGCSSCIAKTLSFVKQTTDFAKLGVILTSSSLKNIKRVRAENFTKQNSERDFIIDSKSLATKLGVSAFPVIVYSFENLYTITLNAENIESELTKLNENIQ